MTGEEEALIDELFTRYRTAMLGRALQYMKHVQDAEDVVSDAWMSLLRQLPKLVVMDERARSTYILRSVQNASVDALRKAGAQARQQERLENEPPPAPAEDDAARATLRARFRAAFSALPPREQTIVRLRLSGKSRAEIARTLRLSPSSVHVYLFRARRHIQITFAALGEER